MMLKKEIKEYNKKRQSVIKTNQKIAHKVMEIFFEIFGKNLTEYAGKLPLAQKVDKYKKDNPTEYDKVKSIPVLILTKDGTISVHYTYGVKNEWTYHGSWSDCKLTKNISINNLFITEEEAELLTYYIKRTLLIDWPFTDFYWLIKDIKKEKEKRKKQIGTEEWIEQQMEELLAK